MDFPSGCFLWRGIFQQIRYFSVPGAFFFCRSCAGSCRVFPPSSRFFIRNLLRFADATCRVFSSHTGIWGFWSFFSVCFVQAPAVFFLRHPDFYPESFAFYGCCLLFFYQPFRYFSVPGAFFSAGLVQAPAVFFLRHPDFSSGIFCILRMPPAMFFPAIPALFPFFCLSRLWKISCFPASVWIFRTNQTRAHSHARNKIWSSLRTFLFLLPQDMP